MANGKSISAKNLLWFIKRAGDTDFMLAACNTDATFELSRDANDEETKCGTTTTFGALKAQGTCDGEARTDIDAGDDAISWQELNQLIVDDVDFEAKLTNTGGDIFISGTAHFTNVALQAAATGAVKFTSQMKFVDPENIDFTATT